MPTRPLVLITNDDGVHAPGLFHLWQALKLVADVTIVAPANEQSGVGLALTTRQPIHLERVNHFPEANAWKATGTPADCVKLGLSVVLDRPPDILISGINRGTNSGRNVLYSGTVGGAIEAALRGIPALALSCQDYENPDYFKAGAYVPALLQHMLEHPLPKGTLLNVNFPTKKNPIQGVKMTRQGKEYWIESPDKRFHPVEEHAYYWLGAKVAEFTEEEDCDISWLKKGFIAAVPIHVGELTDHQHIHSARKQFEDHFRAEHYLY